MFANQKKKKKSFIERESTVATATLSYASLAPHAAYALPSSPTRAVSPHAATCSTHSLFNCQLERISANKDQLSYCNLSLLYLPTLSLPLHA
ncbi:unnamed protein product, partial [Trichogramma brassicae]